jgi:alpha-1,3-rhamnosyltransferase
MLPKVTLVTPCYNHGRYIVDHLESVRAQEYPNIEHIIIEDASTDDSRRLIEDWIEKNEYPCTLIKHDRNLGLNRSLNESLEIATGEYWASVGSDDILLPNMIHVMADFLTANPEELMVTANSRFIDADGNPSAPKGHNSVFDFHTKWRDDFLPERDMGTFRSIFIRNYFPTWMVRMNTFRTLGGFDPTLRVEDWDMWLRVSHVRRIPYIDEQVLLYRWHDSNMSKDWPFMAPNVMKTRLSNYRRARQHVEKEVLDPIMVAEFHENVWNPKSLTNLMLFIKSAARKYVFLGTLEAMRNKFRG